LRLSNRYSLISGTISLPEAIACGTHRNACFRPLALLSVAGSVVMSSQIIAAQFGQTIGFHRSFIRGAISNVFVDCIQLPSVCLLIRFDLVQPVEELFCNE
jgi:hypothetical protein